MHTWYSQCDIRPLLPHTRMAWEIDCRACTKRVCAGEVDSSPVSRERKTYAQQECY
jgi:hypothetical protein